MVRETPTLSAALVGQSGSRHVYLLPWLYTKSFWINCIFGKYRTRTLIGCGGGSVEGVFVCISDLAKKTSTLSLCRSHNYFICKYLEFPLSQRGIRFFAEPLPHRPAPPPPPLTPSPAWLRYSCMRPQT